MEFLNEPAYRGLREAMIPLAVVSVVWWLVGSVPYLVGRRKRAAGAVRFLGLVAIAMQGFGAFLFGVLFVSNLAAYSPKDQPGAAWFLLPLLVWGGSFLAWVVAVVIGLMSRPVAPPRRTTRSQPEYRQPDFEITE